MSKKEIIRTAVTALIVLGLLIGGNFLYKKFWLEKNLAEQVSNIPGITAAQIVEQRGQRELDIQTGEVENLPKLCEQLDDMVDGTPIRFTDNRSDELNNLYRQMEFALQEGIVQGNFTKMLEVIQEQSAKAGVKVTLDMDSDRIYLLLTKDGKQLISVLERKEKGLYLPSRAEDI